ncbi:MAG TPA: hypothetical protein VGK32_12855 [Vicinamibacterales bacterium]|jgi:hypothetical protein
MDGSESVLSHIAYMMVVQRGDQERYRFLRTTFRDKPVEVVWDRRLGERRRRLDEAEADRRGHDRRSSPPTSWSNLGFLVTRLRSEHP